MLLFYHPRKSESIKLTQLLNGGTLSTTKEGEMLAFPCLACIREQGHPDNDWYTGLAGIVIHGEVNSMEIWSLLRKREGQYSHNLIHRIVCIVDENIGFHTKVEKISRILREYGVPRAEDEHTCGKKEV